MGLPNVAVAALLYVEQGAVAAFCCVERRFVAAINMPPSPDTKTPRTKKYVSLVGCCCCRGYGMCTLGKTLLEATMYVGKRRPVSAAVAKEGRCVRWTRLALFVAAAKTMSM